MKRKLLYLGSKTGDFSKSQSVIDNMVPLLSDFAEVYSASVIISLKLTHVFRSKLTHPFTGGSVG